jgi:hypothetical protein
MTMHPEPEPSQPPWAGMFTPPDYVPPPPGSPPEAYVPLRPPPRPTWVKKRRPEPPPARVPRRFGIPTLFVFTAMYAVLFSGLRVLGAPPGVFVFAAVWTAAIGMGQMVLFGGKRPRAASVIVGPPTVLLIVAGLIVWESLSSQNARGPGIADFACLALPLLLFSVPASFGVGCLMAGVFLVIDRLRTGRWNPEPETPPDPRALVVAQVIDEPGKDPGDGEGPFP